MRDGRGFVAVGGEGLDFVEVVLHQDDRRRAQQVDQRQVAEDLEGLAEILDVSQVDGALTQLCVLDAGDALRKVVEGAAEVEYRQVQLLDEVESLPDKRNDFKDRPLCVDVVELFLGNLLLESLEDTGRDDDAEAVQEDRHEPGQLGRQVLLLEVHLNDPGVFLSQRLEVCKSLAWIKTFQLVNHPEDCEDCDTKDHFMISVSCGVCP